jgi:STE24 endopeptidase
VTGLGHAKRVVVYDNLLKRFSRDEVRSVVAHELGHVHYSDVPRGLLYLVLVAPFGTWAVFVLTRRWSPGPAGPAALPALVLALAVVSTPMTWASNQLSRRVEARADSFALELTGETKPFIGFERRIATDNIADPDPPGWQTFLLGTHPSSVQRIGAAVAYERR